MIILAGILWRSEFFGYGPGFVNRTQSDPGFVNPVRSGPGFVNPIRSDPVQVLLTPIQDRVTRLYRYDLFCKCARVIILLSGNILYIIKNWIIE